MQWLTQNPFGCVRRCCCLSRNIMFPATSQVKLLTAQLNIILTVVLSTKYSETRTLLYCLLNLHVAPSGRGGGAREGGRGWWGEGGEERFSVVWPVWGCAGCWVGNCFCHLTPKQEYTILSESFPNKGSYNFVQSKAAHLYPKPPPLWDAPDSCRDDDDVTQCFNFLHKHSAHQMCNN